MRPEPPPGAVGARGPGAKPRETEAVQPRDAAAAAAAAAREPAAGAVPRRAALAWLALIWAFGLSPVLFAFLFPRVWRTHDPQETARLLLPPETAVTLRQALLVGLLLVAAAAVAEGVRALRAAQRPLVRPGAALWLAALGFCGAALLAAAAGAVPRPRVGLLIVPLLLSAAYLLPPVPPRWFAARVMTVLLVYAYGSLLAMLVVPELALERAYGAARVDGFDVRLHGLQTHANLLAAVLATYLVLDWLEARRDARAWLHRGVVVACLVLTQSKTIAALLLALAVAYALARAWPRRAGLRTALGAVMIAALALPVALAASERFFHHGPPPGPPTPTRLHLPVGEVDVDDILSGRLQIWRATLGVWRDYPLLGYGPELYTGDLVPVRMGQTERRTILVPHAHNQAVQTLGQAGLVGAAGLLLYLGALLVFGVRGFDATRGVAWLLVLLLLGRGVTEVPLGFFAGDTTLLLHFVTFAFVLLAARPATAGASAAGP